MKLITFLGTGRYVPIKYSLNGKVSALTPFIQEAIIELYKDKFEGGTVTVFLTETSKMKNWLSRKDSEEAIQEVGLYERIKNISKEHNLNLSIKEVKIPERCKEENLWVIFEKIIANISEGDEIIFDMTHSFRYMPMFALVALYYGKIVKRGKVVKILYGASEALAPSWEIEKISEKKRIAPIYDLTLFMRVLEWLIATDRFIDTGDASLLKELSAEKLLPLRRKTEGRKGAKLDKFITSLEKFSKDAQTCRAPEFEKDVRKILEILPKAKEEVSIVKPLEPLVERIQQEFSELHKGHINLNVVEWCLNRGLIQQGFTILREELINYVLLKEYPKKEIKKRECRVSVEEFLNERKFLDVKLEGDFKRLWHDLCDYRNNINHAGWVHNVLKPKDFEEKLAEFVSRAKTIMHN